MEDVMGNEDREEIARRLQNLEQAHAQLTQAISTLAERSRSRNSTAQFKSLPQSESQCECECESESECGRFHLKILQSMGLAVHVFRPDTGKITFWNKAAEILYGWKASEVLGQNAMKLLVDERYHSNVVELVERICLGQSWVGQFLLRKRSGDVFVALVTKTPMYESGDIIGIISVSSDAKSFENMSDTKFFNVNQTVFGHRQPCTNFMNKPSIERRPPLQLVSKMKSLIPVSESSVDIHASDNQMDNESSGKFVRFLTSKVFSSVYAQECGKENDQRKGQISGVLRRACKQPLNLAANVLSRLKPDEGNISLAVNSTLPESTSNADHIANLDDNTVNGISPVSPRMNTTVCPETDDFFFCENGKQQESLLSGNIVNTSGLFENSSPECFENKKGESELLKEESSSTENSCKTCLPTQNSDKLDDSLKMRDHNTFVESSSKREESQADSVGNCKIFWKDLILGEIIGQGSCGTVYHGLWYGSDVAVKVFSRYEYPKDVLQIFRKEVEIMWRLRHPNVLLFMGAVHAPENLAIVTEYLPRNSLFKILHKSKQALDNRRRLRMALDVARGVNYLHHCNPPIIHGDLKSSNLLVDKDWTLKVGDLGLSQFKHATYISAKSARGTPQWMAPELLRSESSSEKSDVYSFGVVLWELITEQIPWKDLNALQVVGIVGYMDRRLEIPDDVDPQLAALVRDCWHSEPSQRPSFEDIVHRMMAMIRMQ